DVRRAAVDRTYRCAVIGLEQHRVAVRSEIDLRISIRIEVELLRVCKLLSTMRLGIRNRLSRDRGIPERRAQMRRVKPAENSVPVRIVALAPVQLFLGVFSGSLRVLVLRASLERPYFLGDEQHFFLEEIRFAILRKKVSPDSAAKERQRLRPRGELFHQR